MLAVLRGVGSVVLAVALLAATAIGGAAEVAKARSMSGASVLTRAGATQNVDSGTEFRQGDVVRVPTDGRLTVEFSDGASLTLVGPASLSFGQLDAQGRRVVLGSGVVSEAVVRGIALEIRTPDPNDTSLVLQNARGFASVKPGDHITYQKLEGGYAKVWHGGRDTDLGQSAWRLSVPSGAVSLGAAAPGAPAGAGRAAPGERQLPGDTVEVKLGVRTIAFRPAKSFTRTQTPDGGLRLCFNGDRNEFGVVEVGRDTILFLAGGQCVEFDPYGYVTTFDGISHLYHPLTDAVFYDEPVENAAEASPSLNRRR